MSWAMHRRQGGYSLVELVVALTLSAGVFSVLMVWFDRPLQAMLETQDRIADVERAQRIVDRFGQEIASALPNSVRVACGGDCLEFVPVLQQGFYRSDTPGDLLDFTAADTGFDVLAPLMAAPANGTRIVINNLSASGAGSDSVYSPAPANNHSTVTGGSNVSHITMDPKLFPAPSPGQRFYIVDNPVSYLCDQVAGTMRRNAGYAIQASQPANPGAGSLLAEGIVDCEFAAIDSGLVAIRVSAGTNGEDPVTLFAQFWLQNEP